MRIKTSSFCGLARSDDWQNWLEKTAKDLYQDLTKVIKSRRGCRANTNKMMDIYHSLYERQLGSEFENFISIRYPWMVEKTNRPTPAQIKKTVKSIKVQGLDKKSPVNYDELNIHDVFGLYRPHILSFPQKLIMVDNPEVLFNKVQNFIKNKLAVDYIIVDDHAYIEYFEPKYSKVVDRIPRETRDIYKYRQKQLQNGL